MQAVVCADAGCCAVIGCLTWRSNRDDVTARKGLQTARTIQVLTYVRSAFNADTHCRSSLFQYSGVSSLKNSTYSINSLFPKLVETDGHLESRWFAALNMRWMFLRDADSLARDGLVTSPGGSKAKVRKGLCLTGGCIGCVRCGYYSANVHTLYLPAAPPSNTCGVGENARRSTNVNLLKFLMGAFVYPLPPPAGRRWSIPSVSFQWCAFFNYFMLTRLLNFDAGIYLKARE